MTNGTNLLLHYHPFSRASTVVWMLEEVGVPYELRFVDLKNGEQRTPEFKKINPMGKVPALIDGDTIVTETAAIGLYLADRFSLGVLAPAPDSRERGTYLRWSFFAPSVIEPGAMAKAADWKYGPGQAGWGEHGAMLDAMEHAIGRGPWLLGDRFTMADVVFGSTVRFMLRFKMLEARASFTEYVERLSARPACKTADAKNAAIAAERNLT